MDFPPGTKEEIGQHGLSYYSYKIGNGHWKKNMDVILKEEELLKAVELYLAPKMSHHTISKVFVREVRIDNKKKLEVIARLEEKETETQ